MIMKKVVAICKACGVVNIVDDNAGGMQWLGNGEAYYPMDGCPIFDEDSFCAVFDISDKKREKLVVARHDSTRVMHGVDLYDLHDVEYEEQYLPMTEIGVPGGGPMMALTNQERMIFVPAAYVEAIGRELSELTFWVRKDGKGKELVFVRKGIAAAALIWTCDILSERYVKNLRRYTELCTGVTNKQEKIAVEEGD